MTELIWDEKYKDGKKAAPVRIVAVLAEGNKEAVLPCSRTRPKIAGRNPG